MPADFEKCVKDGGRVRTMKMKDGKYMRICYDKGGKSHSGEVKKKENLVWYSPIMLEAFSSEELKESINENRVKIRGTAIKATESRNGVIYEFDELNKAASSLLGMTIAVNHSEDPRDVVGRITKVMPTNNGLDYEAYAQNTIIHPETVQMIRDGLFEKVSIVATQPRDVFNKDGKRVARDIEFLGMDFVRFPGIKEASASIAEALEKYDFDEEEEEEGEPFVPENIEDDKIEQPKNNENKEENKMSEEKAVETPVKTEENDKKYDEVSASVKQLVEEIAILKKELEKKVTETSKGDMTTKEDIKGNVVVEAKTLQDREWIANPLSAEKDAFVIGRDINGAIRECFPVNPIY